MSESEIKESLRAWILERAQSGPDQKLQNDTPILDDGILSSLDVVELVLFVESLKGEDVDVDDIQPEALASIDALYAAFFAQTE
ncbi:MAG: hypothetical protein MJE66_19450 [Proteobacteria bacterium]|nr:hypothetical protein [Pseudomonadota bacterium]